MDWQGILIPQQTKPEAEQEVLMVYIEGDASPPYIGHPAVPVKRTPNQCDKDYFTLGVSKG